MRGKWIGRWSEVLLGGHGGRRTLRLSGGMGMREMGMKRGKKREIKSIGKQNNNAERRLPLIRSGLLGRVKNITTGMVVESHMILFITDQFQIALSAPYSLPISPKCCFHLGGGKSGTCTLSSCQLHEW